MMNGWDCLYGVVVLLAALELWDDGVSRIISSWRTRRRR